jgi:NAD(P)-dependent dehydrogenase (short-subunit alcohol dehydrogenase family)
MDLGIKGKKAIVAGGSAGMGKGAAYALAAKAWTSCSRRAARRDCARRRHGQRDLLRRSTVSRTGSPRASQSSGLMVVALQLRDPKSAWPSQNLAQSR